MRDFSATTLRALARKGITVLRPTAIPDEDGSFLNCRRAYVMNDNGCGRVWTFDQVRSAAQ